MDRNRADLVLALPFSGRAEDGATLVRSRPVVSLLSKGVKISFRIRESRFSPEWCTEWSGMRSAGAEINSIRSLLTDRVADLGVCQSG